MNATPAQIAIAAKIRKGLKTVDCAMTIGCIRERFAPGRNHVTIRAAMALLVAEGVVAETVVSTRIHLNRARGMYTARFLKCDVVAWQPV